MPFLFGNKFKIFFVIKLLIFCLYLSNPQKIFSAGEFTTSFNNIYEINQNGITKVIQNCSLTNKTTNLRASKYKMIFKTTDIKNVYASDLKGPLKLDIQKKDGLTTIDMTFNEITAGKDKTLNWTLSYETEEIASKNGQVWEIIIPGIPNGEDILNYNVTLKVPISFGPNLYFSPKPKSPFFWTKEEIGTGGIKAMYGEKQIFDFKLGYTLNNKNNYPVITEIALPPNTEYQNIYYKNINPKPVNVNIDSDGNWLAQYKLEKNQKIYVQAEGIANIFFSPQNQTFITQKEIEEYTSAKKYWEKDDQEIKKLASELKTPQRIYEYVVNNLSYDYQKLQNKEIKRLGAKNVLTNKNAAICMEFTDLFIALARSAGIPSRELNGFAYTTNSKLRPSSEQNDILHSWPEYYDFDKKLWIQIDPTWGNTTNGADYFNYFDLNHFVFVTKGKNSEYPLPAGSYKDSIFEKKVEVNFGKDDDTWPKSKQNITKIIAPDKIIAGLPFVIEIQAENKSGILIETGNINLVSENLQIYEQETLNFGKIAPYGNKKLSLKLNSYSFLQNNIGKITTTSNEKITIKEIKIEPIYYNFLFQIIGGAFAGSFIAVIAIIARNLYLQRHKQ